MFNSAALRLQRILAGEQKRKDAAEQKKERLHPRRADSTTATMRALSDLGECVASGVHVIYSPVRLYLCVSMEVKPDALRAQMEADRRAAKGMFRVDENWSAAEVNRRWAKGAVLTDGEGRVLHQALIGARGMTDVGACEVFFEFNSMDTYPEKMYLANGDTRILVR